MKNYTITVNGNVYDVTVEENTSGAPQAAAPRAGSGGAKGSAGSGSRVDRSEGRRGRQGI